MAPSTSGDRRKNPREITMLKQILFIISAGMLAVVTQSVHATPFKDIAVPEMVDEAPAGLDLPADR
jgi:hypothetical protein